MVNDSVRDEIPRRSNLRTSLKSFPASYFTQTAEANEITAAIEKAVGFILLVKDDAPMSSRDFALVDFALERVSDFIGSDKERQEMLGASANLLEHVIVLLEYCQNNPISCAKGMNAVLSLCQCGPDKASFNGKTVRRLGALGMLEIIAYVMIGEPILSSAILAKKVGGDSFVHCFIDETLLSASLNKVERLLKKIQPLYKHMYEYCITMTTMMLFYEPLHSY